MIRKPPEDESKKKPSEIIAGAAQEIATPRMTSAEDEIEAALAASSIQDRRKQTRKTRIKKGGYIAGALLLLYGIYYLFAPFKGTMAFGICKVFLELNVQFPQSLRMSTVEELGSSVRIWYTQVDSFGEYRMEQMQCFFKADPTYGSILEKVTISRRELDPRLIDRFNKSLPVIFAQPPDLTLPSPLPDSLQDLTIDKKMFVRDIMQKRPGEKN